MKEIKRLNESFDDMTQAIQEEMRTGKGIIESEHKVPRPPFTLSDSAWLYRKRSPGSNTLIRMATNAIVYAYNKQGATGCYRAFRK
jgi:hypothetical protein